MLLSWLLPLLAAEGSTVVAGIKQYNPNCDMLTGFRKEECQQNKENAGLSGVSWWAWLVLGVVLTLILLVVLRMMCASYRDTARQQQHHKPRPVRHKQRPDQLHHVQQQEEQEQAGGGERQPPLHPMVGLMTIAEYPGGVESYPEQEGYLQYPHYYYPHYLHYPPYTEGEPGQEGAGLEEGQVVAGVPYAHVRYATSDTVYTV